MDLTRYLASFVNDAREHVAELEREFVHLGATPELANQRLPVDSAFRHLHSLKGSAATMGFDAIAHLAHLAEQFIGPVREGVRSLTAPDVDLLLEANDQLRVMVDLAAEGRPLPTNDGLLVRLSTLLDEQPVEPAPPVVETAQLEVTEPHTLVRVRISPKSATPAARAFIVLRRLEAVAEVLATVPPRDALREGRLPGHLLTVALKGVHALSALRSATARLQDVDALDLATPANAHPVAAPVEPRPTVRREPKDQVVRVRVELLDSLLELAGELVLSSGRLREANRRAEDDRRGLEGEIDRLGLLVKDLNNRVLAARQTPVLQLTAALPRIVRDLSVRLGKPLQLITAGADVTLDRGLLDALTDPVVHALRNAADHGIESPEERARIGKPATGRITFATRRERERVIVELRDDGTGFDTSGLRRRAVESGALPASDAATLSEEQALRLALLPGLSTRAQTNDVSGRGVGLDAVLVAIEQLGGTVTLQSWAGVGSCIRFSLPATVSLVTLLLVELDGETFGVPMSKVLFAAEGDLARAVPDAGQPRTLLLGDQRVAAFALGRLLGLPEQSRGLRPFVVVEGEGQRAAVGVDRLLGQEEAVLRPLGPPLDRIRGLAGTAILGSGRPIFVLDVPRLVA